MDLVVDGTRASPGSTFSAPVGLGSAWGVVMTGVGGEGKARGMSPRDEIFGRSWRLALSVLALSGIVDDSGERNEKRGNVMYGGVAHRDTTVCRVVRFPERSHCAEWFGFPECRESGNSTYHIRQQK